MFKIENRLKTELCIAAGVSTVMAVGMMTLGEDYIFVTGLLLAIPVIIFILKVLISFMDARDIFAPQYIFPALFILVAVLGALGGSKISVLYIAKVKEFKWQLYSVAMVAYMSGIGAGSLIKLQSKKPQKWNIDVSLSFLKIIFIIGIVSMLVFFQIKGGIPVFQSNIDTARFKYVGGLSNIVPYFGRLLITVSVVSFICFTRLQKGASGRFSLALLIFLSIAVMSLGGGRMAFIEIFFVGLVIYHYTKRYIKTKNLLTGFVIIMLLFSVAGYFRSANKFGQKFLLKQLERIEYPEKLPPWTAPPYVYSRIVVEVFHLTENLVPRKIPYQYGSITFGDFLTLLPGKQLRPDFFYTEKVLKGDSTQSGGTALSFMTSFYFDCGPMGIATGFFFVGFLLEILYRKMKQTGREVYLGVYSIFLFNSVLGVYGTILFSPFTIWDLICILMFHFLVAVLAPLLLKTRNGKNYALDN